VALRVGFAALLVALASGAVMIATGVLEVRSGNAQLAYDTAGSLKPLHFVAMHGILVLPGLAWLIGFSGWDEHRRTRLVWIGSAAYAALTAVVGYESATGSSPLAASPVETILSGTALAVLMACGIVALAEAVRQRGVVRA
jgi:hypothetical protein